MQTSKIYTNENCVGCNLCIASCPCEEANVAVMENGVKKIYVDDSKCIACGECLRKCTHNARDYYDDTERFFSDLRDGKKIAVIAAPAIRTNFPEHQRLLGLLRKMGVSFLFDTSFGADICTWAYLRHMTKNHVTGLISQPCPAIVNYMERYTPELLGKLAPIHSPAMCTAVYMKKYKKIPGSYAFLSPCVAKKDEFDDGNTGRIVEYNVTFKKCLDYLEAHGISYLSSPADSFDNAQHGLGAIYPMPGGLKVNVEQYVDGVWVHQVEGQPHTCRFLDSYASQSAGGGAPFLVDILNCQHGCNMGTGAIRTDEESLQVGRELHKAREQAKKTAKKGPPGPVFSKLDKELNLQDFRRGYTAKTVKPIRIASRDVENAFAELKKYSEHDRHVDCRSCGYASCRKMAEAVAKGINHPESCVEYFKSVMREQNEEMEEIARQRARQAEELRDSVENIFASVGESSVQTEVTMSDVRSIHDKAGAMNEISQRLSSHVNELRTEINKYIKMSDEIVNISSQTNILALNASVEAARAGQHGKGFAVVAEQIKRLSDQSGRSAQGALANNEHIIPILKQVNDVSEGVLKESKAISVNVESILNAVAILSEMQRQISETAKKMAGEGHGKA